MKFIVKGRNIEVTPAIHSYAEDKISKVGKYLNPNPIMRAEVELMVEKNPSINEAQVAEVTLFTKGHVIRAKSSSTDMYASIDEVSEKIERQIKKYKGKLYHSAHKNNSSLNLKNFEMDKEERRPRIVKTKRFAIKPMTPEEATMQMELLGHDFFVFINSDTGEVNVVYRRRDGNYGLIEPSSVVD